MSEKQKPSSSRGEFTGDHGVPVEQAARPVVGNRPPPVEAEEEVVFHQERRVRLREDINVRHADNDIEEVNCDVPTVAFINNDAVPIYGTPSRGTSVEVETGCLKTVIQELSVEKDRLRGQLVRADITHKEDRDRDTEDRQGRKQRHNICRGSTETWWKRRCDTLSRHYFSQGRAAERIHQQLLVTKGKLETSREALLVGLCDEFFTIHYENLRRHRQRAAGSSEAARLAWEYVISYELLCIQRRNLTNSVESLRVRILTLEVDNLTKRYETESAVTQVLKSRYDALTPLPNPDDSGSDIFEVSGSSESEEDSDGTDLDDEAPPSDDNPGEGIVPGDHPDIPSTSSNGN